MRYEFWQVSLIYNCTKNVDFVVSEMSFHVLLLIARWGFARHKNVIKWGFVSNSVFTLFCTIHDDVIKWKHFPRYWPFVRGINRSPVNSPHKGQWRGAVMFSLICVWVNNREAGDLRRYRAHYDVIVMDVCKKEPRTYNIEPWGT